MYLMIDNYDSYVYNLVAYMEELKMNLKVIRNDKIDWKKEEKEIKDGKIKGIVISPGPKHPDDFPYTKYIMQKFKGIVPILGVCLGHQMIADAFGAKVIKGETPVHGKISHVKHTGKHLFEGIPDNFKVTRYHSLVVSDYDFPAELIVDARCEDGRIMGLHHKHAPIYGIQFHPEAVLTEYGHEILENYKRICERWRRCQYM